LAVTVPGTRPYDACMFLLVSGASGAGKSTARRLVAGELEPGVECVELHDVVAMPRAPTLAWRQRATEAVVCHALKLQEDGRHVLLAGDPVAAGEVLAAPSADRLDGIAVCLLDVARDTQAARLVARGDVPTLLVHHVAFADWMREHAADPHHRLEVLQIDGWEQMRKVLSEPRQQLDHARPLRLRCRTWRLRSPTRQRGGRSPRSTPRPRCP
jgi:hypothetical protein